MQRTDLRNPRSKRPTGATLLMMAVVGLAVAGCRAELVRLESARPTAQLATDPHETGEHLDRWPGFRGPGSTGVAPGGSPPIEFGPDKALRWRIEVPGSGYSSPAAWSDGIFLTSEVKNSGTSELTVLRYSRTTGEQVWATQVGEPAGATHGKNGYASATVATDGEKVFAFFGSTGLFALDAQTGEQLWRADLGDLSHMWGTAASPVLFKDMVIQNCDSGGDSYLAAFDKETGERRWRTERDSTGCWTTPIVVRIENSDKPETAKTVTDPSPTVEEETADGAGYELIVAGVGHGDRSLRYAISYNPSTGEELWRVHGSEKYVTPTPTVFDGVVICSSGRNGPIKAIRLGGQGDVTNSHVIWQRNRGGPYIPSGLVYRGRVYFVDDRGTALALNPGDGSQIWREDVDGKYTASLVAADGRLYAIDENGVVSVLAADDQFQLLATNDLGDPCLTTPAIVDGDLLIRTEKYLWLFEGTGGVQSPLLAGSDSSDDPTDAAVEASSDQTAEIPMEQPVDTPVESYRTANTEPHNTKVETAPAASWPAFRGCAASTGVSAERLPAKLTKLWTFETEDGDFPSASAIVDGVVYAGSSDGNFYAIGLADGKERWRFQTELGFSAAPMVHDGLIFIGDYDGVFYCLDAATGKPKWQHQTDAEINSSANLHGKNVLVGSQDGKLYCFDMTTGEVVWEYESGDMIQSGVVVTESTTMISGCDGQLHVVNLADGKLLRKIDLEAPTLCTPAVLGSMTFVGTTGQQVLAVNWETGEVVWSYMADYRPNEFRSSAALTDELVIVGSRDKRVHAIDRRTGKFRWEFQTGRAIDASPVIVASADEAGVKVVFVGSEDGQLYGLNAETGEQLSTEDVGGRISASAAVAQGRLVVATDDGRLLCFGRETP